MAKSLPSTARLQDFARIIASDKPRHRPKYIKPVPKTRFVPSPESTKPSRFRVESETKMEENSEEGLRRSLPQQERRRFPLAEVVSDCVNRWFQETLRQAKSGDSAMQVLVGQMYNSGYGVPRDAQKGRAWIKRAAKIRSSVWKFGDKPPGYNASDSDSDDMKGDKNEV